MPRIWPQRHTHDLKPRRPALWGRCIPLTSIGSEPGDFQQFVFPAGKWPAGRRPKKDARLSAPIEKLPAGRISCACAARSASVSLCGTPFPRANSTNGKPDTMGDKSPKSVNKKAAQKQSKTNASNQKKQQVAASKQAVPAKKK